MRSKWALALLVGVFAAAIWGGSVLATPPHGAHRGVAVHPDQLREIVPGADRHHAERRGGALLQEPVRHLVHGAVAAHSHDAGGAVARRLRRERGPVTRVPGARYVHGPALTAELARHGVEHAGAGAATRCGIHDDMSVDQRAAT